MAENKAKVTGFTSVKSRTNKTTNTAEVTSFTSRSQSKQSKPKQPSINDIICWDLDPELVKMVKKVTGLNLHDVFISTLVKEIAKKTGMPFKVVFQKYLQKTLDELDKLVNDIIPKYKK